MNGKRIILTVTNDLTYDRRMFRICNSLAETGAFVSLVGRRFTTSLPLETATFRKKRLKCIFRKGSLFYVEYNIRLFIYLLFSPFDIGCACDLDTVLAVRLASVIRRKKTVYDAHEFFTEVPELIGRPFIRKIWEFIAKVTIPGFNLRYTVGEDLAILMSKKYNSPFHIIRNIPSISQRKKQTQKSPQANKILLYQGALNVGRGLEATLHAMQKLPDWQFWIAGEGDITDHLKHLSKELGLESRVSFLGWVFSKDLPPLMQQAKLGINLREVGSLNDYYSLPNKFFDFIHAGLPSINMNYPEYERVCAQYPCAFLIDTVSPEAIVTAIEQIENTPDAYAKMQHACYLASLEFTWEKESEKLKDLYTQIIHPS